MTIAEVLVLSFLLWILALGFSNAALLVERLVPTDLPVVTSEPIWSLEAKLALVTIFLVLPMSSIGLILKHKWKTHDIPGPRSW
ncbi:uncharacterized protein M421DRAFT_418564 [Didymella exigua CBS 183.55]|uniref:Uncharacterized protein n=1 Tax=Didymella exigua CBS 183.55 TaxID=1150837 RepID=A0A6A5RVD7_9PLEO|nr:uncharacterized protein M421DRAFT_418564 [Didymella exigua CBS 183.55]KAF1930246.1 hypothetical protein M421DRAFT_418564 [Didymella exigua CBS 183.55]